MTRWNSQTVCSAILVLTTALFSAPAHAAEADENLSSHVRAVGSDIETLIAAGQERSATFRGLVARIERSDWGVFVLRGRCPEPAIVACLLHTVVPMHGRRTLRVILDSRRLRPADVELGSLAHELQHVLEVAEFGAGDGEVLLPDRFRRLGFTSLKTPTATAYETEAARRAGYTVLKELDARDPKAHKSVATPSTSAVRDSQETATGSEPAGRPTSLGRVAGDRTEVPTQGEDR